MPAPFQNKSPLECALLLRKCRQNTSSDLNYEYFVMLDARSLEDDTVLMVNALRADEDVELDEEELEDYAGALGELMQGLRILTVRAEMAIVNGRMLFYAAEGEIRDDMKAALEAEDGVFRESLIV